MENKTNFNNSNNSTRRECQYQSICSTHVVSIVDKGEPFNHRSLAKIRLKRFGTKKKSLQARTQYYKDETNKMKVDIRKFNSRIKENKSKLLLQTDLPHLVSTEISKGAVIKISTRNTIFFPVVI